MAIERLIYRHFPAATPAGRAASTTPEKQMIAEQTIEGYLEVYSDFYKEAYGVRPRHDVSNWDVARFEQEFKTLATVCEDNNRREAEEAAVAIAEFEESVKKLINVGAKDRAAAIRWLHDREGTDGDTGFLEYKLGLPYDYLSR